jgi:hypothetical protein
MVLNYQTVGLLKILIELFNSYLVSPINCWIIEHLAAPGNIADIINLLKNQPHILLFLAGISLALSHIDLDGMALIQVFPTNERQIMFTRNFQEKGQRGIDPETTGVRFILPASRPCGLERPE